MGERDPYDYGSICQIPFDTRDSIKTIRTMPPLTAMILKIDRASQIVVVEGVYENCTVEKLAELLDESQPRYILYVYEVIHDDARVSQPLCLLFFSPQDSLIELQLLYACTKGTVQREAATTRVFEIRDLDDLTESWLKSKFK